MDVRFDRASEPSRSGAPPVWISGEISTFANKFAFPVLFLGLVIGAPLYVLVTAGRISIRPDSYFIVAFALLAAVLGIWGMFRIQRIGHQGSDLLMNNYIRTVRVPLERITAVERVALGKGMVRIRFNHSTPFGRSVYYLPKWAAFKNTFGAPQRQLEEIIEADRAMRNAWR